jgi:hypothetical protein
MICGYYFFWGRGNVMKKINFGIVLILLTFIFLTLFIITDEMSKSKDKKNVKEIFKEYLNTYNKYSMLEKEDRNIDKNIDINEYNKYLSQMKQDLSKYVSDDKLNDIYEIYKQRLDKQFYGKYMLKEYDKQLMDVVEYSFYDSYISVTLDLNMTMNRDERITSTRDEKTNKYDGKVTNVSTTQRIMEFVVFKKIGNEYKIVMHNIADLTLNYTRPDISIGGTVL